MKHAPGKPVQRQRTLPLSKAIEIAWKQIRMRLSRSLLVTSGIVLAIAFLIAIQINDAFADGMRSWIGSAGASSEFVSMREERKAVESRLVDQKIALRNAPAADASPDPSQTVASLTGLKADELKQSLGELPLDVLTLEKNLASSAAYRAQFSRWLADARIAHDLRERLNAPKVLEARLADNGVPTRVQDVAAAKLQNRWLLGLALLVAFVGILNAMLMSVTERFREIGTMKCLGALDGFIVKLFLIESLFQGIVGTAVGLIVGVSVSVLMNLATYGTSAFHNFQTGSMLWAIGVSAAVGVVLTIAGAVWPAWQAARMHPIEAMRVEA
jgi:predicted outer membrane lipoprotein